MKLTYLKQFMVRNVCHLTPILIQKQNQRMDLPSKKEWHLLVKTRDNIPEARITESPVLSIFSSISYNTLQLKIRWHSLKKMYIKL